MADAGKVAILPRGLWSAEKVYEPLDLVYYNNNSFVALKESVGVTPVDGDTWMLSLSGIRQETIDAILNGTQTVGDSARLGGESPSYYGKSSEVTTAGDTRTEDTNINDYSNNLVFLGIKGNEQIGLAAQLLSNPYTPYSYVFGLLGWADASGGDAHELAFNNQGIFRRTVSADNSKSPWRKITDSTDLANYLPLDGSKPMTGNYFKWFNGYNALNGSEVHSAIVSCADKNDSLAGEYSAIVVYNKNAESGFDNKAIFQIYNNGVFANHDILHTGNKPTGTYTGNGSAEQRIIQTGGIGNEILILGAGWVSLISNGMGFSVQLATNQVAGITGVDCYCVNGDFNITTTREAINSAGIEYIYRVL